MSRMWIFCVLYQLKVTFVMLNHKGDLKIAYNKLFVALLSPLVLTHPTLF